MCFLRIGVLPARLFLIKGAGMKLKVISALFVASMVLNVQASADQYVSGFKNYQQAFQGDAAMAHAFKTYLSEIDKLERQYGYIGAELPLPPLQEVVPGVYVMVGSMIWHNPTNYGLNNNLAFAVFDDGVFVFNAGANPAIAYTLHQRIKRITHKPVKWVAVENSQGHAYLGASYWVDVGVKNLYASARANADFADAFDYIKDEWSRAVGHEITGKARNVTDKFTTFNERLTIDVGGGEVVELIDFGPGHTPGSAAMYIPSRKVIHTGDLAFNERMLAFFPYTYTLGWIDSYKKFIATIPPDTKVIPGHGTPTDMKTAEKQTLGYLTFLHREVEKVVAKEGRQKDVEAIDQSAYKDRPVYEQTHQHNAVHVYKELTGGDF
jgi:glyoxylase-like metal-dependent hydrolase (beta-lactamase superfamily II)